MGDTAVYDGHLFVAATDQAIDNLVYELYDLTDEEIAIVAEATT